LKSTVPRTREFESLSPRLIFLPKFLVFMERVQQLKAPCIVHGPPSDASRDDADSADVHGWMYLQ